MTLSQMYRQAQSKGSEALSFPPRWLGMYEDFVAKNASSVGQIEGALRSLTYIIPGNKIPFRPLDRRRLNHYRKPGITDDIAQDASENQNSHPNPSIPASNSSPSTMTPSSPRPSRSSPQAFDPTHPRTTATPNSGPPNPPSTTASPSLSKPSNTQNSSGKW